MLTLEKARLFVVRPQGIELILHRKGITKDIMTSIIAITRQHWRQAQAIAPLLRGQTEAETLSNVHRFCFAEIQYRLDPKGKQWIKRPSATVWSGFADCKGKSILVGAILECLGIEWAFRFVSYPKNPKRYTHIYNIAGKNSTPIDACLPQPFFEVPYISKVDYKMETEIAEIGSPYVGCAKHYDCSCNCHQVKTPKISGFMEEKDNPYLGEVSGLFKKKEGGTKLGNLIRKGVATATKIVNNPIVQMLPIPGKGIAKKVVSVAGKIMNVVDKTTGNPQAVPLQEIVNTASAKADELYEQNVVVPAQQALKEATATNNTGGETPKKDNTMLYVGGALALYFLTKKKK